MKSALPDQIDLMVEDLRSKAAEGLNLEEATAVYERLSNLTKRLRLSIVRGRTKLEDEEFQRKFDSRNVTDLVKDLQLSPRILPHLLHAKVWATEDLCKMSEADLMNIDGIGIGSARTIIQFLRDTNRI